jgi:hypothetical protein
MHVDIRGLPISAASAETAAAYDHVVGGYLTYRANTPDRLKVLLEADPDFALAHCMKGYFAMLGFKQAVVPVAVEERAPRSRLPTAHAARAQSHRRADRVVRRRARSRDRDVGVDPARHPHDAVAFPSRPFRQFLARPPAGHGRLRRARAPGLVGGHPGLRNDARLPLLRARGDRKLSRRRGIGRRAIELDPGDLWAAHAIAHVLESQGRRSEGIQWLTTLAPELGGQPQPAAPSLVALRACSCTSKAIMRRCSSSTTPASATSPRRSRSPRRMSTSTCRTRRRCCSASSGTASMSATAGTNWPTRPRRGSATAVSAFTLPHWLMALTATGRTAAAQRMIEAMRVFARAAAPSPDRARLRAADRRGPARPRRRTPRRGRRADASGHRRHVPMGGSHRPAGRARAAFRGRRLKAGSTADVRLVLERVAGRRAIPPERFIGWREAANRAAMA